MERFSPVYFEKENFPTRYVRPEISYNFVYPKKDFHFNSRWK